MRLVGRIMRISLQGIHTRPRSSDAPLCREHRVTVHGKFGNGFARTTFRNSVFFPPRGNEKLLIKDWKEMD